MTDEETFDTYLDAADAALALIAAPQVSAAWEAASALPDLTVGALAAHLGRSITRPALFLDGPDPASPSPVSAAGYYAAFDGIDDRGSAVNRTVVASAVTEAAPGRDALVELLSQRLGHLRDVLADLPAARQVEALGHPMTVAEYLRTRLVEFAVHVDDLALSEGLPTPALAPAATGGAIAVLVEIARLKHGDVAVLRALARRERDGVAALRVL